jgi:hypothetical protein
MRVRCNAAWRSTNMVGDLPGYGTVWYDPRSIVNILSLSKGKQKYLLQYNSSDGKFVVKKPDESFIHFIESPTGFFFDTATKADNMSTVDTPTRTTVRQLQLETLLKLGRPSVRDFMRFKTNSS